MTLLVTNSGLGMHPGQREKEDPYSQKEVAKKFYEHIIQIDPYQVRLTQRFSQIENSMESLTHMPGRSIAC